MLVLFFVLLAIGFVFALLTLDDDLHERRLRRTGRISLDAVEERTGWSRKKIEETLDPVPPERVYPLEKGTLKRLPRNPLVAGPDLPLLNLVSVGGLVWAGLQAGRSGAPEWGLLAIFGGYQALATVWQIVVAWRQEEDDESAAAGPMEKLSELQSGLEALRQEAQRDARQDAAREDLSPFWTWVYRLIHRRQIRSLSRLESMTASLSSDYTRVLAQQHALLVKVRWELMIAEREQNEATAIELRRIEREVVTSIEDAALKFWQPSS